MKANNKEPVRCSGRYTVSELMMAQPLNHCVKVMLMYIWFPQQLRFHKNSGKETVRRE